MKRLIISGLLAKHQPWIIWKLVHFIPIQQWLPEL